MPHLCSLRTERSGLNMGEIIHLDTEEYLKLDYFIEFISWPLKACVTRGLWEEYETKMSQFSFNCNYARMKLVSIIPLLYSEACLAFLGNKESSSM